MANKTMLNWVNPTQNTDGSAYDAATENAGYNLAIDSDTATVALPFALGTEFDMKNLQAYIDLPFGSHEAKLAVVNKGGFASAWSNPATFLKGGASLAPSSLAVV